MKKHIGLKDAVGKTIEGISNNGRDFVVLSLSDNSYVTIAFETSEEGNYTNDGIPIRPAFDHEEMIDIGILTQEEYEQAIQAENKIKDEFRRCQDQREYLRLKKIFEPKS